MTQLISKVQYINFEIGEFVDVRQRDYGETIAMIQRFPWNTQRDKITISLTNPSVTIEGKNYDFLKLMPFYHQKFALHFFDAQQTLFTKSFASIEDAFPFIQQFFAQPQFEPAGFRKEPTWFQSNLKHFATNDFRYHLTPQSIRKYLWTTSGISLIFSAVMLPLLAMSLYRMPIGVSIFFLVLMFLIGGGVHLIFFFYYYRYAKGKILIMSRCNDTFYFGNLDNPVKYDKKDILQYSITKLNDSRRMYGVFAVARLKMKGGTVLTIPNLLADEEAIGHKLWEYKRIDENWIPVL